MCAFFAILLWSGTVLAQGSPTNLLSNPGFETLKPAYWEPTGIGAVWSNTESRTPAWSLRLSGPGEARWEQSEAVRGWISGLPLVKNPVAEFGAWFKLEGVNTDPASEDEKYQLVFEFFEDASQTSNVLGGPIVLDLPQGEISTDGWIEVVSGPISFPSEQAGKSARISFRKGDSATGIAFMDDLFIRNVNPAVNGWVGEFFNPNMDAGDAWGYWWGGSSSGSQDWRTNQSHYVSVSDEDAHSGDHSLRIESNGSNSFEAIGISAPVPIDGSEALLVSFWVKHSGNTSEESIGTGLNNLGLTALWFDGLDAGSADSGVMGGVDIVFDGSVDDRLIPLLGPSGDWMHYAFVLYPIPGAVGMEIRPRYWHEFTGVTYWDDFFVAPASAAIEALLQVHP
jgi:hypothetical protein